MGDALGVFEVHERVIFRPATRPIGGPVEFVDGAAHVIEKFYEKVLRQFGGQVSNVESVGRWRVGGGGLATGVVMARSGSNH